MQAGFFRDRARALVDRARIQPQTGHEQERGGEQEDEESIRERTCEQPASDRRVGLDDVERQLERRVVLTRALDARSENARPRDRARESAGDRGLDLDLDGLSRIGRTGEVRLRHPDRGAELDLRGQLGRVALVDELVTGSRVEVDVRRRQRDEGHGHRVDDPREDVHEPERGVGDEDQQRSDQRPGHEHERASGHDQRGDLEPLPSDEAAAAAERGERGDAFELDRGSDQRPASGQPDRDRDQEDRAREDRDDGCRDDESSGERRDGVGREPVGADRPDPSSRVDLHQRTGCRRLNDSQCEERQRRADGDHHEAEEPAALAACLDSEDVGGVQDDGLQERHEQRDRQEEDARCR